MTVTKAYCKAVHYFPVDLLTFVKTKLRGKRVRYLNKFSGLILSMIFIEKTNAVLKVVSSIWLLNAEFTQQKIKTSMILKEKELVGRKKWQIVDQFPIVLWRNLIQLSELRVSCHCCVMYWRHLGTCKFLHLGPVNYFLFGQQK